MVTSRFVDIDQVFRDSADSGNVGRMFRCPVCDFEYNHIVGVLSHPAPVGYPAGEKSFVEVAFRCEGSHTWSLCVEFSKGLVFARICVEETKVVTPVPKAIETRWLGYRFRSRNEARWAVWFHQLGVKFEYEKEGFVLNSGYWLPDFYFPETETWVEIKPDKNNDEEKAGLLCHDLSCQTGHATFLVKGAPWPGEHLVQMFSCSGSDGPVGSADAMMGPFDALQVELAYSAARGARFEHGEKPAE
jgi:hypothetical protein